MKVLHVVGGNLNGGAARGAYWLHLALRKFGVKSKILINSRQVDSGTDVRSIADGRWRKAGALWRAQMEVLPLSLYPRRQSTTFSSSLVGFDISQTKEYEAADIVHLHWVNAGFLGMRDIARIKKPLVWTLRDMWPMTGGCHYSMSCDRFISSCGRCPQLGSNSDHDLSWLVMVMKRKRIPKNTKVVGISNWISEQARASSTFSGFDVRTIFNCIDTEDFFPIEKRLARNVLGFNTDKKVILVGAQSLTDYYKGFDKFMEALHLLDKDGYRVILFGKAPPELMEKAEHECTVLGYLHDSISLRLAYSAADVFVAPSLMDAFGKTLVESMACGTPVVCFDATGPKDIVDHKVNGYRAVPYDAKDMAEGIRWVCESGDPETLAHEARRKSVGVFDADVIAPQYISLYEGLS